MVRSLIQTKGKGSGEMNMTQAGRAPQHGKINSILLWSAVAILVVALFVAFAIVVLDMGPLAVNESSLARGIEADAARWTALGQDYAARGAEADAARWAALGHAYTAASSSGTLPYTDVSHFYAERMRAQARENAQLAANPELMVARRGYRALDPVALNPELAAARRGYSVSGVFGLSPDRELALNPELGAVRRYGAESKSLYTDVSKFYVERLRTQITAGAELDADAEMVLGSAHCVFEGSEAAASEGLLFFRSERGC
jgi:hypothetical protein